MKWNYEDGRIFSISNENDLMAEVTFVSTGDNEVNINRTYVNPALRGQGIAGDMLELVAKHLREKGIKATASCSYANTWLKRNREKYSDIISENFK
ncbi:MAG: N-acetyltransferase [Clostridiales bacterium]|jgi:predicted GNAT family acetyltransferase|nr:N-acetyltransferase [Clostridiales bacterium]